MMTSHVAGVDCVWQWSLLGSDWPWCRLGRLGFQEVRSD